MRNKLNCWEYMECGREPGGEATVEEGVCPAALEARLDGVNSGQCGGRACWGVPDTYCMESLTAKFTRCLDCPFFQLVEREQASAFTVMGKIVERLSTR